MGMREEIRVHLCAQKLYEFRKNNCNSNFTVDTTAGSIEESYRIQDLLKAKYLKEGINICGWKAGIVSTRMQKIISSDQTFLSPIFKINNIENNCNLDYKEADERGYFKLDFLNNSAYTGIKDEAHLQKLLNEEPIWDLLQHGDVVAKLAHIHQYIDILNILNY